jgi:hypothetical protein
MSASYRPLKCLYRLWVHKRRVTHCHFLLLCLVQYWPLDLHDLIVTILIDDFGLIVPSSLKLSEPAEEG